MSSTRTAKPGSEPRQERYASSARLRKGLLGNLVARRCEALKSPADRQLVYFLHELSLRDGFAVHRSCNLFPAWPWPSEGQCNESAFERVARELVELWPKRVKKSAESARKQIAEFLPRLCLDASIEMDSARVTAFDGLIDCLVDYKARFESAIAPRIAQTEVTKTPFEALDFALAQRGIVLLEGSYRSGKTYSAQAWCLMHLGRARYVQISSSADETSFYRAISKAIGCACSIRMKCEQMRVRVEETLRGQQLLLLIDEADYLFGVSTKLTAPPSRINWLMTALVNQGVPVALIGSRNFDRLLTNTERRCPVWGSEQFYGRIRLRKTLPSSLSQDDLFLIADLLLPSADWPTRALAVGWALESKGHVAALETIISRARYFAERRGHTVDFPDVREAMIEAGYKFDDSASQEGALRSEDSPVYRHLADRSRASRRPSAEPPRSMNFRV